MNFEMPPRSIPTKPDTLGPPPCPDHGKASASGTVIRSPLSHEVAVWCSLGRNENRSPVEASKISVFQLIWTIDILTSHQVIQWTTKTGIHIHNYHVFIIFDMICIYPISQANVFKLNLHIVYIYIYWNTYSVWMVKTDLHCTSVCNHSQLLGDWAAIAGGDLWRRRKPKRCICWRISTYQEYMCT